MSVALLGGKVAVKLLALQLLTFVLFSIGFVFKSPEWGFSALLGGLAAWLPNVIFMFFAWRHQTRSPAEGRVAWSFAIGEALKVLGAIALLVVALGLFKAAFFPLGLTYVAVLLVAMLAPAVMKN